MQKYEKAKSEFRQQLENFVNTLQSYVATPDQQWSIKGLIDVFRNVYTISSDTKIVSKIPGHFCLGM